MPEYRQDPLTGRTVIIAEERASRPHQFDIEDNSTVDRPDYRCDCPFCEGNEDKTPGELEAFRPESTPPDSPGWTARAIPNKFPAVARCDAEFPTLASFQNRWEALPPMTHLAHRWQDADLEPIPGVGNHEVLVDTPRHVLSVSDMTDTEVGTMLKMYKNRLRAMRNEGRWACAQIFKNVGAAAGASIPHAHSQLIAMPFVPQSLSRTLQKAEQYALDSARNSDDRTKPSCFWCDMLAHEIREKIRIVEETELFVALCPFVSRFTAEVEIYPKRHEPGFDGCESLDELARLLRRTVRRLENAVSWMKGPLAYNFVLQTAPFVCPDGTPSGDGESDASDGAGFHWHLSILPSLARAAGFEWGMGLHINPISPENAAARLREAESNIP